MICCINDTHLGAIRAGGTTTDSALMLRHKLLTDFSNLVNTVDSDLLINGDLLDSSSVPMSDLLMVYTILSSWLTRNHTLYLVAGNHDLPKNSANLSSFQFLAKLLRSIKPDSVVVIEQPTQIAKHETYVIPHVGNQDIFDSAVAAVPSCRFLYLHCNYDSSFAAKSDHSLNLTASQAEKLPAETIIIGHEHQYRTALGGKVLITGNQFPSSIADCIGNDNKSMIKVSSTIERIQTWQAEGSFSRQDWRSLTDEGNFIRVEGSATAEEAGAVVTAISKFRSKSKALVITNAVVIDGIAVGDINLSLEQIQAFSVLQALLELLSPEEGAVITKLIKDYNV